MIFVFIRLSPFLIPLLYFIMLEAMFYFDNFRFWPFLILLLFNALYFLSIFFKKRKNEALIFLWHSSILLSIGLAYPLILGSQLFINLFIVIWLLVYLVYLESTFHYFYGTKKILLMDLKNVLAYVDLLTIFFLSVFLINLYVFVNLAAWLVLLVVFSSAFWLIFSQLKINQIAIRPGLVYALVLSLLLTEVLLADLFLSVSFYVSAVLIALLYYLLVSLSILNLQGSLTRGLAIRYLVFTLAIILIVALTSQWL
ncbi:MAG: hypothetical protein A3B89_02340 [Candidatus Buchananbacteria bacterium RIFCSPHIGHO2_02_FULL_40_13]|uniref:Uncharacterized protein n=1 Tax=Candidatus Buchananbacteria bacterium RIFCSPLOWO2_01_FULL_39_33 TaxID=1797543 RepID=A0A1G1YJ80_9BACT|nr:MAG: hypothetical protein A3B89_02340 [Candidatus Buchananbacteria bacterium RIFCSPHIGHO2_02_FULL_40_13]OGY52395.1 MAG: hypothetical protein A3A02_02840 [Candidatus Buchananbacteria bacterium RIFCSPLOWO2_01_FULL_39_33]